MGDMFLCKTDKIFSDMPNVFDIMDAILVIGYDENGADHDTGSTQGATEMCISQLKIKQRKCHFR